MQPDASLVKEGYHPVIDQVRRGDGALVGVELGGGNSTVGINKGLLVDPAHTLDGAHIVGVLGP